ncbi:MAG: LruC domain-containing protein [Gilvibacter sp.]|nr:LruC domain-containing protein [Gilvibacter sp.]
MTVLTILCCTFSCSTPEIEQIPDEEGTTETGNGNTNTDDNFSINIPEGFDYSTHREVKLVITDAAYARYDVFAYVDEPYLVGVEEYEDQTGEPASEVVYRNDVINKQILTAVVQGGQIEQTITIPKFCSNLYIRRNENLNFSAEIVPIVDGEVNYFYVPSGVAKTGETTTVVEEYLFCVNGSGEHFQVDRDTGEMTYLSDMPMGSWTAAVDQDNGYMYSIGRSNPHPLMRYSIATGNWDIVGDLGMGGPRLAYNSDDNLLYFSDNQGRLFTIDPYTATVVDQWQINGLHNSTGGDLDFAADGTIYLCTFSGLYRIEYNDADDDYDSYRISADNLPFQPTSMTIDFNGELWLADNGSNSDLIIMDTTTGGWEVRYGASAGNDTNFGRTINDLTTFKVFSDVVDETDTDGDGVIDIFDTFPDDADKAYEIFTPSKYGTGTFAFEDLWPSRGDYDFNDMAYSYRAIVILNAENKAVQLDLIGYVKSNGAGFNNGVGIEIEGISPDMVESVSGTVMTKDYITLNPNGTEANQDNAVIILTDDADYFTSETTITIRFTSPIATTVLGSAPFNPFIIVNGEREREVHLPYRHKTNLAQETFEVSGVNADPDGDYISDTGLPWAISIIHDFKVPKESVSIDRAYNHFVNWASSGGNNYTDWYKDNPGYRNTSLLDN